MKNQTTLALAALLATSLTLPTIATAQIYKYKDKNGRWVYTDKKPSEDKNADTIGEEKTSGGNTDNGPKVDLKQQLESKYPASSAELKASLAVVTVRTKSGFGSGFFVTDNGYLITNKHVVRPNKFGQLQQQDKQLENEAQNLRRRKSWLKEEKSRIASNEGRLREMKKSVESPGLYRNPVTREEYEAHKANHEQRKKDYKQQLRETQQQERDFKKRQRSFALTSSATAIAKRFTLILKDGQEINASLVKISKEHDLALLKVSGYHTPFLTPANYPLPSQSQPVFAIGSPKGVTDSITAGKVMSIRKNRIMVDAKILSGNSGGPLIDDNGYLLGVNTWRINDSRFSGDNGFGVAIPIKVIMQEFGQLINGS
ncbi:trypsin-like peptidase domain-containing protein [Porticoccus sp. W117]|uniref:trypsin-like peptidase domain-containing protein n=1 Tax=Porticoccus sp. W117 TaxID=3054777 RepID=UPI0025991A55|nr:trypsin-like peptidase domain-containing protein [Porticoccus sp. W117]MDM3872025.1 trypsin-like peptidase domain-containing protein [Porticoccus sp. W117]